MSKLFFYLDSENRQVGPLPLDEIEKFVTTGIIGNDVMISKEGSDNWRPFSEVRPCRQTESSFHKELSTQKAPPPQPAVSDSDVNRNKVAGEAERLGKQHAGEILSRIFIWVLVLVGIISFGGLIYSVFFFDWW
ncbi:MAG: DUF4339 domain-containing protein [Verrucomicrobiales bacterium]